ncbi:Protein N-acetyltransferase, RimJ/RimL family [Chitinophaga costaii]|uniref:Protein N-acetyltransferase, RimJ/RimL family n=1 Tax=Chitinophaga costaii TaxID=1335309 RepID=A0A1C4D8R2_9BACT|nr:GNAT family protein [Chitinophaga costaii]PUZ24509.1 N-acetyltransferase [Chitinophaga costaii]SCC27722.1 Protein N-acetyltransferase, RimJ/RimL family [Chitinophaga costaii]
MDFNITLENKRVRLQPLQLADFEALKPIALLPELWKVALNAIDDGAALQGYLEKAVQDRQRQAAIPFLVFDKQKRCVAGSTRFMAIDLPNKRVEIGSTWIHPSLQGTGLNKAMKYAMLQYAFETAGLNRVELKTDERNQLSQNAMRSIGAQYEGTLRQHAITSSGFVRNTMYFSILAAEWPDVKRRIFAQYDFVTG